MGSFKLSQEDYTKLSLLSDLASYHIDDLFSDLNIDCKKSGKMYIGSCPVHDGDRINAWNFYPNGYAIRGIWRCRTKQCEGIFQKTIPGLVRGILSKNRLGWHEGSTKIIGMQPVIDYLCNLVGQEWKSLKIDLVLQEKHKFINDINHLGLVKKEEISGWDLSLLQSRLEIPSKYFINRGLSKDILIKYNIGDSLSTDPYNPMYKRAVIPVLSEQNRVIGTSGRSLFPKCSKCQVYHENECPQNIWLPSFAKWRHTPNFPAEDYLFNFFNAKEFIEKSKTLIIVEGPIDCLRLVQAGIKNVVALFGVNLSDAQSILIESSWAHKIVLLLDRDKAGETGINNIKGYLSKSFKIYIPEIPKNPSELSDKEIEDLKLWNY